MVAHVHIKDLKSMGTGKSVGCLVLSGNVSVVSVILYPDTCGAVGNGAMRVSTVGGYTGFFVLDAGNWESSFGTAVVPGTEQVRQVRDR